MKYAQIFTYQIDLPSKEEYLKNFVDPYAESISKVKGLISKVWLADFENKYASFYLWETKEAMEHFMNSPMVAGLAKIPFLKDLTIVEYPVVEEASKITRGI
ncbi:MAG: YdhR family protein [Chitinophagales bacterium]